MLTISMRRTALVFQHECLVASRVKASRTSSSRICIGSMKSRPFGAGAKIYHQLSMTLRENKKSPPTILDAPPTLFHVIVRRRNDIELIRHPMRWVERGRRRCTRRIHNVFEFENVTISRRHPGRLSERYVTPDSALYPWRRKLFLFTSAAKGNESGLLGRSGRAPQVVAEKSKLINRVKKRDAR